jgi:hypothetical protein
VIKVATDNNKASQKMTKEEKNQTDRITLNLLPCWQMPGIEG